MSYGDYDDEMLDAFDKHGPYIPSKTWSESELHFITEMEKYLGRVPSDAEVVGFCFCVICPPRKRRYVLWKGALVFITDIIP